MTRPVPSAAHIAPMSHSASPALRELAVAVGEEAPKQIAVGIETRQEIFDAHASTIRPARSAERAVSSCASSVENAG